MRTYLLRNLSDETRHRIKLAALVRHQTMGAFLITCALAEADKTLMPSDVPVRSKKTVVK